MKQWMTGLLAAVMMLTTTSAALAAYGELPEGALEVPGGTMGTAVKLNRPAFDRFTSAVKGPDGALKHRGTFVAGGYLDYRRLTPPDS